MEKSEIECCGTTHLHDSLVHQIEDGMPKEETIRELSDFFKVFGGMTQSAVSHQLRILKQMKLVKNRREGKTVFYSLADGHIQSILNQGMEHIIE